MTKIAVIAAMEKEAALLKQLNNDNIIVEVSGIGKVAAALKTLEIIKTFQPDLIISSGVAGGLDSSVKIGDTVVSATTCYHDVWCGEPNADGQVQDFPLFYNGDIKALSATKNFAHAGLIISGDQFISSEAKLLNLKQRFPEALAVDMETAAIAQTCYIYKVPFISLRLISDTPGEKHHQEQYDNFWHHAAENSFKTVCGVIEQL